MNPTRYRDPKGDLVFKRIFGEHRHLLRSFLNAVLPLPDDGWIVWLKYIRNEQFPITPDHKSAIVDVKCRDRRGRIFIVEMQMDWQEGFQERLLFYASSAYVRQL